MIASDASLTPVELANRRKAQQVLLVWPLAIVGIVLLGATTSILNDMPTIWRGLIYLGDCFAAAVGVVILGVCLFARQWRMAAINGGCVAAAILFLVVAGFGAFGPQFPRTVSEALKILGG